VSDEEVEVKVIKLYRKPDKPEFFGLIKTGKWGLLVEYPLDKPYSKRVSRWLGLDEVYIDWIREFV
jgi:hypothetical protein